MTIATARSQGADLLLRGGIEVPQLTAEVLLCYALGRERAYLYAHPEQELREVEWLHYGRYLHQRLQGKPTQYITKTQEFFGRAFRVEPGALIPRPETEHLVEAVLKEWQGGRLVDVGVGSGAIAITLALEAKHEVIATDISMEALAIAQRNADSLDAPVRLVAMDLLEGFGDDTFDAIVSNPPYVPEADQLALSKEVRDWEPHLALFGGEDGFEVYERLIPESARVLKPGGLLALEIGFGQSDRVRSMLRVWSNVHFIADLQGIPRVALANKSRS